MSTAQPVTLHLTRTQAGTVLLALVADVRKWSQDASARDLLADAWDALEAVSDSAGLDWLRTGRQPGETTRAVLARTYSLPVPPQGA
jgi:hypothetical protein